MLRTHSAYMLMVIAIFGASMRAYGGPVIIGSSNGISGTAIATSSPGAPFNLDYTSFYPGLPLNLADVRVIFASNADPTNLDIQLSGGAVFTIPMLTSSTQFEWYNPQYDNPSTINGPNAPLPQSWWDELSSDGVATGHVWATGATRSSNFYQFVIQVDAWNVPLPEPSGPAMIILGVFLSARRRRCRR